MGKLITLDKINKFYTTGKNRFHALRDVSLTFDEGEMVAIMGKSGCGKTTLLNVIGTLDDFDDGTYRYKNMDVAKMRDAKKAQLRAEHIGFVNQDFFLLGQKTALSNVMLPLYFGKAPFREMKERALDALDAMGVEEQAHKKIIDMSGGQKQRVALARALVISPSLILADEPTGALDSATAEEIVACLRKLNREEGITVIIVTHDSDVAAKCDRIVTMSNGKVISEGR